MHAILRTRCGSCASSHISCAIRIPGFCTGTTESRNALPSRKLYVLQGLPGIGPALASRLLLQFGSIERVVAANADTLTEVRGVGRKKAARIREVVG